MYYVYELINHYGTVEYVGETKRPKQRLREHTKRKPGKGVGMFYGRTDLVMNIVSLFTNRKEARELEGKLKLEYGMEHTESTRNVKGGKIGGKLNGANNVKNGHLDNIRTLASKKISKRVLQYTISGQLVNKWESMINAEKKLGIFAANISNCVRGKTKSAGGFIWKYEMD